jgi:predicted Na+-dependent transporter
VPAAAACARHPARDAGHCHLLLVIYSVFSACGGRMREASCSSMMHAVIILYLFFIYF